MKRLYAKYKSNQELVFLTVSINVFIAGQEMKDFLKSNQIDFPVLIDLKQETTTTYSELIPFTYFVDRDGIVRDRVAGPGSPESFERGLATILTK